MAVRVAAEPRARRARIVATLGPSTDGIEADLVAAGLDVARLNFSHGTAPEHARRVAAIRRAAADQGRWVGLMQDLQGPKIRVGRLAHGGPVQLREGQDLTITTEDVLGTAERVGTTYADLPRDVRPGDPVLLDDGRIRLTVLGVNGKDVRTRVEEGGPLGEHKGINLPGVAVSAPSLTEKDREDLRFGLLELEVDYVALSFVRTAEEVREARELVRSLGRETPLIVKLEKPEALDQLHPILRAADGVMVARGDLGVEMAPELVPAVQKTIIRSANRHGVPVITATQMLESMMSAESPTRAEATDVANAVWDGSDAVMLSGETAVGQHPLLAVKMMDRIVRAAESAELPSDAGEAGGGRSSQRSDGAGEPPGRSHAAAIAHAARILAEDIGACAIVGITRTGRTAELLSRGRPRVPVFAFCPDEAACRRLALWWGVTPVHLPLARSLADNIAAMEQHLLAGGTARSGDRVVVVGAHPFQVGVHTNFLKFQVLRQTE